MSDWTIKSRHDDFFESALEMATLGFYPPTHTYEIENTETGETRTVNALDEDRLGERISRGDFDD